MPSVMWAAAVGVLEGRITSQLNHLALTRDLAEHPWERHGMQSNACCVYYAFRGGRGVHEHRETYFISGSLLRVFKTSRRFRITCTRNNSTSSSKRRIFLFRSVLCQRTSSLLQSDSSPLQSLRQIGMSNISEEALCFRHSGRPGPRVNGNCIALFECIRLAFG